MQLLAQEPLLEQKVTCSLCKTRPHKNRGKDMDWALKASYEDLDPALYDTNKDPHEVKQFSIQQKVSKNSSKNERETYEYSSW